MKYLLPIILAVILFSSCDITKRRYLPGYSIEWRHKAPKPVPVIAQKETIKQPAFKLPAVVLQSAPETREHTAITFPSFKKYIASVFTEQPGTIHHMISTCNRIAISSKTKITPIDTTLKKKPVFYTGDEQEDDYARKSLIDGILSLAIPAATFLIMFAIALSLGETLANAAGYAVVIFIIGCIIGLFFSVLAFINGFLGINEIDANSDIYTGRGEAVLGMILGGLAVLGAIAYLAIRFL